MKSWAPSLSGASPLKQTSFVGLLKKATSGVLIARKSQRTDQYASPFSRLAALLDLALLDFHCRSSHLAMKVESFARASDIFEQPLFFLISVDISVVTYF